MKRNLEKKLNLDIIWNTASDVRGLECIITDVQGLECIITDLIRMCPCVAVGCSL